MTDQIEIYVRPRDGKAMLNILVPPHLREQFLRGLQDGAFQSNTASIALELSPLPQWITDPTLREQAESASDQVHLRIPVAAVNLTTLD